VAIFIWALPVGAALLSNKIDRIFNPDIHFTDDVLKILYFDYTTKFALELDKEFEKKNCVLIPPHLCC